MILDLKNTFFLLDMFLIVGGGGVPVTGMLAGMNLSKPGINLSKPWMNLSKPGKKHRNHVIIHDPTQTMASNSYFRFNYDKKMKYKYPHNNRK